VFPALTDRRALAAYVATWLGLSWVPASILAAPGGERFWLALLAAAPPTLLLGVATLPLHYLCRALPLRPANLGRVLRIQLVLALGWSFAWWLLLAGTASVVDWAVGGGPPEGAPGATLARAVDDRLGALVAVGALLELAAVAFHYLVASARRARASERRAAAASLQAREAQLALLQAQVHPHFLFNSLHAISALTVQEPKLARRLCVLLAEFLRASLAMGARGMVRLEDELQLSRTYLDIERIRLGDRLTVALEVTPPAADALVPALLLQPVVENAVTHGVATCAAGGALSIAARTTPAMLELTVTNPFDPDAPPRRAGGPGGVGLANVARRLAACYEGASLTTRREADRFTAVIVLPATTQRSIVRAPDAAGAARTAEEGGAPGAAQGPHRR
jgi:hypothetical protein